MFVLTHEIVAKYLIRRSSILFALIALIALIAPVIFIDFELSLNPANKRTLFLF